MAKARARARVNFITIFDSGTWCGKLQGLRDKTPQVWLRYEPGNRVIYTIEPTGP